MERSEHLKFCRICKNRKMSSQKGIICGLTGDIADFEDECPDFVLDAEHQQELEEQKKKKKSFDYEATVAYIVPKPIIKKYNSAVLLLPFFFVGAHLFFSMGVKHYVTALSFWSLTILFIIYLVNAAFYRKYPLETVTISTILSALTSLIILFGAFNIHGTYLFISLVMSFSYFFILSQLHSHKQKA